MAHLVSRDISSFRVDFCGKFSYKKCMHPEGLIDTRPFSLTICDEKQAALTVNRNSAAGESA